jgi:hypothetical protein
VPFLPLFRKFKTFRNKFALLFNQNYFQAQFFTFLYNIPLMPHKYIILLCIAASLFGCSKNPPATLPAPLPDASYTMKVTTFWSLPAFTVPAGVHITTITGMVHSTDTMLWKPGIPATPGLEDVAEIGSSVKMNVEIDAIIAAQKAS